MIKALYLDGNVAEMNQVFTVENGLMTPTFKLKRKDCYEQYKSQRDCAYIQWVRFEKGRKRLEDISLEDISDDELPNFVPKQHLVI